MLHNSGTIIAAAMAFTMATAQLPEPDWEWNRDIQLAGCREVGCPNETFTTDTPPRNWDLSDCKVAGAQGLGAVGIAENIFDVPDDDTQLSLTVGRTLGDSSDYPSGVASNTAAFQHRFFIGKPPGFNLTKPESIKTGCILIWQSVFHTFSSSWSNVRRYNSNRTTCDLGLDNKAGDCFSHITDVVSRFEYEENGYLSFCQALAHFVNEEFRGTGYTRNAKGNYTGCASPYLEPRPGNNVTGLAFLGPDAPTDVVKPGDENSTCHPVRPQEYELAELGMMEYMIPNRYYQKWEAPLQEGLDGTIPVMSVIFKEDNTTTVQMACTSIQGNPPAENVSLFSGGGRVVPVLWTALGMVLGLFVLFV